MNATAYLVEYIDKNDRLQRRVYHTTVKASNAIIALPSNFQVETRPIGEPIPYLSRKGNNDQKG